VTKLPWQTFEWLENLASAKSQMHAVRGDFDEMATLPETKVVQIGNFRFGLIHGHQVVPWGDLEALAAVQRQLDVDILISGHTHQNYIETYDGKYFINPGSATGAYSCMNSQPKPSFMLIAVQGDEIVAFIYELINDEINVQRIEIAKKK
jgi:vacuolar protein sorting-associated protein 29